LLYQAGVTPRGLGYWAAQCCSVAVLQYTTAWALISTPSSDVGGIALNLMTGTTGDLEE